MVGPSGSEALSGEAPRALLVEGVLNPINCRESPPSKEAFVILVE